VITGVVTAAGTAVIPLTVQSTTGHEEPLDAIVDTGFNGFLTLPLPQIAKLGFPYEGNIEVVLGDGRGVNVDVFLDTVVWEGQIREGTVVAADGSPLVGMALLSGSRVCLDVTDSGPVTIARLP
jgi:clan AA aspartic protease